jgi:hypothetical protein
MPGHVIHSNVTMPEPMFPICRLGRARETRCDIPQFELRATRGTGGAFPLSGARGATDCHVYGRSRACGEVNDLIGRLHGEALGSVDLPHEDLAAIKVGSGGNPKVWIWRIPSVSGLDQEGRLRVETGPTDRVLTLALQGLPPPRNSGGV